MECTTNPTALNEHHVLVDFLDGMDEFDLQTKKTIDFSKEQKHKRSSKAKVQGTEKSVLPWNKRKEEIKRLRDEVQVMEAQLAFLRLQDLHAKMYDQCAPEGQKQQKAAALRERQRRQEAQIENSQLKAKIKNCVSICEVMKSTLQVTNIERAEQTTKESLFAARSLRADLKATQRLSVLNTAIFNILEHHARIREWDSVLYEAQHFTPTTETDTD